MECGHTTSGASGNFVCNRPAGHPGLHEEAVKLLRHRISRTNWGDDGKAHWATSDVKRLKESGYRA